jgi:hypothetical protein
MAVKGMLIEDLVVSVRMHTALDALVGGYA